MPTDTVSDALLRERMRPFSLKPCCRSEEVKSEQACWEQDGWIRRKDNAVSHRA